jgi:hypothetical protein
VFGAAKNLGQLKTIFPSQRKTKHNRKKIIFTFKAQTIFRVANLDRSLDFLGCIVEGLGGLHVP